MTQGVQLGKKLGVVHDPRTLQLARYVSKPKLPKPPARVIRSRSVVRRGGYPMFANDRLGDCTCATAGHMELTWSHGKVRLNDQQIVKAYADASGYPEHGDNGAYELDVLNYWRKSGIGGHRILAFAAVKLSDHALVHTANWLFGGVYIGIALPISAQSQVGRKWEVVGDGKTGSSKWGSWGGHAVHVADSDAHGVTVVTWGKRQRMSWRFWDAYVDEAYAIIAPEWLHHAHGTATPQGFNLKRLEADLAAL